MNCPICQHNRSWHIDAASDAQVSSLRSERGDLRPSDWRLCRRCGNAFPSSPPDLGVLRQLWEVNRTDAGSDASAREKLWAYRRSIAKAGAERSYRLFAPLAARATGRFLDIGCGLGETVRIFANRGWDAEGIDADPSTAPMHREIGIRAQIGQFESVAFDRNFDIIHIAHAIYFISEPMHFLHHVRERLASDGLFCVVLADFLANDDLGQPTYAHTFYPTGRSMQYALALAGFKTVMRRTISGSIYIAARPAQNPPLPAVWPPGILMLYRTKKIRFALLGRPYLTIRRIAKRLLGNA